MAALDSNPGLSDSEFHALLCLFSSAPAPRAPERLAGPDFQHAAYIAGLRLRAKILSKSNLFTSMNTCQEGI